MLHGKRPSRPRAHKAPGRGPAAWRWPAANSLVLAAVLLPAAGAAAPDTGKSLTVATVQSGPYRNPREQTYMKRHWGVEVMHVRESAGGYMLEFRYKVLDAKKAAPLFERRDKPVLIHAESGAKLVVPTPPTTGALRNSNTPLPGHVYWMVFANPGGLVKPGQHVTIEIGKFRAKGLRVQ